MKKIEWKKVTWYSQIIAIILFVGIFFVGFCLGRTYQSTYDTPTISVVTSAH